MNILSQPGKAKKLRLSFMLFLYFLAGGNKAQCDFEFDGVLTDCNSPNLTVDYCYGNDFCFEISGNSFIVVSTNWSYSGTNGGLSATSMMQYNLLDLHTSGVVLVVGMYDNGYGYTKCPFNLLVNVNVHDPSISISSPLYFALGSNLTLNSNPVNVTPPAAFAWTPNLYFVSPSTNTDEDPVVSPLTSMVYQVYVTDAFGCMASTQVEVIAQAYAPLTKTPEGSYYLLTSDNKMLFKYDGQYASTNLVYNVYDKDQVVVASSTGVPANNMNTLAAASGDNRYYFDAASLAAGYYTLEVINEKNEKLYLRFIR